MSSVSGDSSPQAGRTSVENLTMPAPSHHGSASEVPRSQQPVRPVKVDNYDLDVAMTRRFPPSKSIQPQAPHPDADNVADITKLRVLIVEVQTFVVLQHYG
jgi:hypothetical protein